ncbi:MAG: hypothetical protein L6Q71_05620 [Planctomycetes bacterium]|nr:hypothetical protein [Planctomycetota bacterium]NUQ34989.1 hypothetical protein [Planctomycetaceae bacterium]
MTIRTTAFALARIVAALVLLIAISSFPAVTQARNEGATLDLVQFRDLPLSDALRMLAGQSDLNLVASTEAAKMHVSLELRTVSTMTAVRSLCRSHGLVWRIENETNIVHIATPDENDQAIAAERAETSDRFVFAVADEGRISLTIVDLPLSDVLQRLAQSTPLNLVATTEAAKTRITVQLKNVEPVAAVETLCRTHGLLFQRDASTDIIQISLASGDQRRRVDDFTLVSAGENEISLTVRDIPLGEALRRLSERTGLNVVASAKAEKRAVSIHLNKVTPMAAVQAICSANQLWFQRDDATGVVRVSTAEEYKSDLESFRHEQTQDFTLMYANAIEVALAVRDLFGERVELSLGESAREIQRDLQNRLDRLAVFGGSGNLNSGAGTGTGTTGTQLNNNLQTQQQLSDTEQRINRQLDQLRGRGAGGASGLSGLTAEQIQAVIQGGDPELVESLLRGRQASIFITVIYSHNKLVVRTSDGITMDQIRDVVTRLDVPTPLVLLEVKVLSVSLGDGFRSVFDYQFTDASRSAVNFTEGNILPPFGDAIEGDARRFGSLGLDGTGLTPGDLTFQFVDRNFRARVQMLEDDNRVTQLATPLLLTTNNEASRLFIGEERPLNRNFDTQVTQGTGTATTSTSTDIEFRAVGTSLLITPTINADRTVTLRVLQETSSILEGGATVLVPTDTGFTPQAVDIVRSQNVSGTIVAKDGFAVAIGGLIEEEMRDQESKVPVLGDIPLLGFFFKRTSRGKERSEIVVMIRPYVLNTPSESEAVSRELLSRLSLHPNAPGGDGTLGLHDEDDVLQPNQPNKNLRDRFRFHSNATPGDDD